MGRPGHAPELSDAAEYQECGETAYDNRNPDQPSALDMTDLSEPSHK
jgi:hypothetical protein